MEIFYEWKNCTLRSLLKQSMQKAGYQTTLPLLYSNKIRILLNCTSGRKARKSGWCCASTRYCASFHVMWLDRQQAHCQRQGQEECVFQGWVVLAFSDSVTSGCRHTVAITRHASVTRVGVPTF